MKSFATFKAQLEIIGVNPFVYIPDDILHSIFEKSGKNRSPIRVKGMVNGKEYRQNLVKFLGEWRLYINLIMLKNSTKRIGEIIEISIEFDDEERVEPMPEKLQKALEENPEAMSVFEGLIPSRKLELKRYINNLKTEKTVEKNIEKIILYLTGKTDFFGRKI